MDSNRRRFLGAAGVAAVASLTGCAKAVRLLPAGLRGASEAAEKADEGDENNDPGIGSEETDVTLDPNSDSSGDSGDPSWDVECTNVTITDFNWEESLTPGGEDTFTADLLNESEYAGTVTIRLEFYESDAERSRQGTIDREFAFGAQERRDMMISANPPTSESQWVVISVVDQDC